MYQAIAFLGEVIEDQKDKTPFASRFTKNVLEAEMFLEHRDLVAELGLVCFDTTSIYLEGEKLNFYLHLFKKNKLYILICLVRLLQ